VRETIKEENQVLVQITSLENRMNDRIGQLVDNLNKVTNASRVRNVVRDKDQNITQIIDETRL
jgi:hypothetical protein